jgi:predicted anti-sigma-YlaC factor YlaD
MNNHLNDEQLVASALGESDRATALHLQECSRCREDIQSLNGAIGVWAEDVRGASGPSPLFWRRQREAVAARLERRPWLPWKNWAWATATLTLVVLAAVFYRQPAPVAARPPVDDNALLLSVHTSLASEVPEAFEPVTLLTQEIDRVEEIRPAKQETTHENGS